MTKSTLNNLNYTSIFDSLINEAYDKAFCIKSQPYYTTKDFVFKKESDMKYTSEETETNILIKFEIPGLDKTTLKVEIDPYDRSVTVSGKYNQDTILESVEEKTCSKKVYLNNIKWDIEPEKTYLKDGILYIQFKKQESFNKKIVNVDIS
jgi:HSP20 family molecular chaperone IbpA